MIFHLRRAVSNDNNTNNNVELVTFSDAVDAIIAALIHQPDAPMTFTAAPESIVSLESSLIHL